MFRILLLASLTLVACGCERRDAASASPFQQETCDFVLLLAVDRDYVVQNDKAYEFVTYAIDRYFHDTIGSNNQVIIAQLSGTQAPLLWQGSPHDLRRQFANQEEFRNYLLTHGDSGSRINLGLAEALDYLMHSYSVANGKAKSVALILSDMIDDQPESKESERQLMDALIAYGRKGSIGFYFCDQRRMADIRRKMEAAGFGWYTLECDIHGRPPLPSFE